MGGRRRIRLGSVLPSSSSTCSSLCSPTRGGRQPEVDSELRREASCLRGGSWVSNVSRGEMFEGIVGSTFLGWDQHGLRCLLFGPLFKALRVPIPVLRTTPSIAWGSTVFGVAGLVIHFEARKVVRWVLAHWFVMSCIHSLEPTETGQATPGVSIARLVPWVFYAVRNVGRCGSKSPAEFGVRSVKPVTG